MYNILVFVASTLGVAEPLVAEVLAGHRANLERVRTLKATYTFKSTHNGKEVGAHELRYLRDLNGTVMRGTMTGSPAEYEYAILPGEVRELIRTQPGKTSRSPRIGALRKQDTSVVVHYDLWWALGGLYSGNDLKSHDLASFLAGSDPPATARRDTRGGVSLIKVTCQGRNIKNLEYKNDIWFDPARGYVPIHSESTMSEGQSSSELSGLTSFAGGIWLPTHYVNDAHATHGTYRTEYLVTELKVNEPLPAGGTTLPLPAGTIVEDELRKTEYPGNTDWTPAGPEKPWKRLMVRAGFK